MAFSVSTINGWVNENNQTVLSAAILEPKALQGFFQMPGVKYKEQIKYLGIDTLPNLIAYACGDPTSSGTTSLTDKDITVVSLMQYEELCPEDLNATSFQLGMKPGMNEDFSFEQEYVKLKIATIQKAIEGYAFSTSSGGTAQPAGILSIAGADSDVNDRSFVWSATTWTASDYFAEIYGMYNDLPVDLQNIQDLMLYVPHAISRKMLQTIIVAGNYHIDFTDPKYQGGNVPWIFPGTNITVFPTQMPANNVMLTPASNLIEAYDLQSEFDSARLWWDENEERLKFKIKFRIGFNYFFGDYIVWSR
jgi:hypothetical protein